MVLANDRLGLAHGPKMPRGLASALSPPVLIGPREPGPVDAVQGDEDNPPSVVCAVAVVGGARDGLLLLQPMGQGGLHWHWHLHGRWCWAVAVVKVTSSTSSTAPRDDAKKDDKPGPTTCIGPWGTHTGRRLISPNSASAPTITPTISEPGGRTAMTCLSERQESTDNTKKQKICLKKEKREGTMHHHIRAQCDTGQLCTAESPAIG